MQKTSIHGIVLHLLQEGKVNYLAAGCLATSISYAFLCYSLKKGKVVQNLMTWLLWAALDIIIAASVIYQGGNWPFIVIYVAGCLAVSATVFKSSINPWTRYETLIAGTIAVVIAGIPQLIDIWKRPEENPFLIYVGFLIGNILSTAAGKEWSIQERFYPVSMVIFCVIFIIAISRKFIKF